MRRGVRRWVALRTESGGDTIRRAVSRDFYRQNLVNSCSTRFNDTAVDSLPYTYDALSRPTARNSDVFDYNERGEVISAQIGTNLFAHAYDFIGNQTNFVANAATNSYTHNALNQLVGRDVPIAPQAVMFAHDLDGNMTSDGVVNYAYDAANRLSSVTSNNIVLVANQYDYKGRRIKKTTPTTETTFIYDGWNLIQETVSTINGATTNTCEIQYFWGSDLSESLQGAGGVGGLLATSVDGFFYFPTYDNNGNVTKYIDESGNVAAAYEYDDFGRTIAQSGQMADIFRIRFSTKYYDPETDLYYYGYRFYAPVLMRWLNRDPIKEKGGNNLYIFCANNPVLKFDMLGLTAVSISMGTEFKTGRLGNSEFMRISITVLEKPESGCHLNFIQLKKPSGGGWSIDSGRLGPYYYSLTELKRFTSSDDAGRAVVSLYDSPGGALSEDVMFYVAVVEVSRSCSLGKQGLIKCFDKVKLIDSRIWTYHPYGSKKYSYENISRGKGMIPTLKQLVNSASWSTELCSSTKVEIKE